ncbi:RNase A-like domain-containing protein [Cedecea neteri]|uniref:RNase A-like domain-containing protein n=1 Tax=Cedecea neteri TaxID=158822 RepID=UPI002AA63035|nr:RNase A-like domain-containing protein [Cedecea neteri]WPU23601.1 RNase A-like domain-containing protein [Cedecea neteri]
MFNKTRYCRVVKSLSFTSGLAISLFISSAGAWAANTGLACTLPAGNFTAANWVSAQKTAATNNSHLVECHIGKDTSWLQQRTVQKQGNCTKQATASSWSDASAMWQSVGADIKTFCEKTDVPSGETRYVIKTDMKGSGAKVGEVYSKTKGSADIDDTQGAVTVLERYGSNNQWYILTGYPVLK